MGRPWPWHWPGPTPGPYYPCATNAHAAAAPDWAVRGFTGQVTAHNFGVNWVRRHISWDQTFGTAPGVRHDDGPVSIHAGTESASWDRIFFGLTSNGNASGLFKPGSAVLVQNRLADLSYLIQARHAVGRKLLVCLDSQVTDDFAAIALRRDRLMVMYASLQDFPDAIQDDNEPLNAVSALGPAGFARLAESMRVLYTTTKAASSAIIVCSPPWQGGDGPAIERMLGASAAGVTCGGSDGAGTRGEMFYDVLCHHFYGEVMTLADAETEFLHPATPNVVLRHWRLLKTALDARRAAADGGTAYWSGRPDRPLWCDELNVCPRGGQPPHNAAFRMQFFSPPQRGYLIRQCVLQCLAIGCEVTMPYTPDHDGNIGPWSVAGFTTGAGGCLRITSGDAVPVFDGDQVLLRYGNVGGADIVGIAANATLDGLAYDVVGAPASAAPGEARVNRALLGGWASQWEAIQASFVGQVEAGFVVSGDQRYPYAPLARVGGNP